MAKRQKKAQSVKLTIWAEVRREKRTIEVPAEDLDGLSDRQRERLFDEIAEKEALDGDMVGWGWDVEEDAS